MTLDAEYCYTECHVFLILMLSVVAEYNITKKFKIYY